MIENQIAELKRQLTGDLFADADIRQQIAELERSKVEASSEENLGSCSLDDQECLTCGS